MNEGRVSDVSIRPTAQGDLTELKCIIDAADLFPSEMLDEMVAPFLADAHHESRWLTSSVARGAVAVAYYVPERMTTGTWNLLLVAVHPDCQGRGVGSGLMRYVEADLASSDARLLLVETSGSPTFAATRAFYRHIGYGEEARIRDFYQPGEDKIVFRKVLTASR